MRRRIRIKVSESYARFTIYLFSFSLSHSLHPLCYAVEWDGMEKLTLADSPSSHMHKIKFNPNLNWNCQSFRFRQCHTHFTAIHLKAGSATTSNALAVCERKHQMTINQCHDCHAASVKRHHKRESSVAVAVKIERITLLHWNRKKNLGNERKFNWIRAKRMIQNALAASARE